MADLYFQRAYKPEGISTLAMSQYDGSPEPVIRELLQNSLDAASEAGRATEEEPAEVTFRICELPLSAVPGLDSYRRAFDTVVREHEHQAKGPDAAVVIGRIADVLGRSKVTCLVCRDNGVGLDDDRLPRILAEADSNKAAGGGSFGVGHMTAFSASDLRYVLYGGRFRDGQGQPTVLISGHAVLSSHRDNEGTWRTADGYLMESQSDLFSPRFCLEPPALMRSELDATQDTGAIVCIMGFNCFREEEEGTGHVVDAICRVASTNFLSALWRGRMIVRVCDEVGGTERTVDGGTLGELLGGVAHQQRVRGSGKGWIAGAQAYRAWRTLEEGRRLASDELRLGHLRVWFRKLGSDGAERPRVNLFRNGMWITRDAPGLRAADFGDVQPFDAVVSLVAGDLYDLVRSAEGPEHRGLEPKRMVRDQRLRLRDSLKRVGELLRSQAGELSDVQEFVPAGFAVFSGERLRSADPLPAYRPRPSEGDEPVDVPQPGPGRGPRPAPGTPNPRRPRPGTGPRMRSSLVPLADSGGLTLRLRARIEVSDGDLGKRAELGVRVRRASGSDETCDQPIPPEWLSLEAAHLSDGRRVVSADGGFEVPVPAGESDITIVLSEPVADVAGVELDVVRRRVSGKAAES